MCTGRLAGRSSIVISAPWVGGFAKDLCSKEERFGSVLDWEQCSFTTEGVDIPAIEAKLNNPSGAVAP
jgi:hypothetical protein